jgi:actin-related protein 6
LLGPVANAYNDIPSLFDTETSVDEPPLPTAAECLLLIDSGYSHTTITPLLHGRPIHPATRRLNIGGKILTNYLKEQLSIRSINLMDETYAVDEMKEAVSFVSPDFRADLERTWKGDKRNRRPLDSTVVVEYVLPDYEEVREGVVRPHDPVAAREAARLGPAKDTVVTLGNERFSGPELFFNPTDVGMQEAGLPEVIMQSVEALPETLRAAMLANVVLVGGNVNLPGFTDRVYVDPILLLYTLLATPANLRCAGGKNYDNWHRPRPTCAWPHRQSKQAVIKQQQSHRLTSHSPIKYTWLGASRMASNREVLKTVAVTKAEYMEHGGAWVARKFASQGRSG